MEIGLPGGSVRERVAREKARLAQQQQQQGQFDPNKLAQGVLRGDVSGADIASLQSLGALPQQEIDVDTLLSRRSQAMEQNIDTSQIDQILAQAGYKPTSPKSSLDNVEQLIAERGKTKGERDAPADLTSFLKESQDALVGLEGRVGAGFTTGPLSFLTEIAPGKRAQVRSDVATLADKIRNDLFGSAVTALELKTGNVPSKSKQEGHNRRAIQSIMKRATKELENKLYQIGFNDEEIDAYFQKKFGTRTPWQVAGLSNEAGGGNITTSAGNTYTIVEE